MRKFIISGIVGVLALSTPLLTCDGQCKGHNNESKKSTGDKVIDNVMDSIAKVHKDSVTKIFGENIEIGDKPKNHKNWGEWIMATNSLDTSKWRALKVKGTDMWGISLIDGKNDCGAVLWICQHSKKMVFDASKFAESGLCAKIRESYKGNDGNYKKISVPLVF